ncbi:hypothetical protein NEOLI_004496 [Neolecta irregularis DAH-3]|uniref:EGF-like domain-containing protein n=1 Tax=Neolecta irregularis (strain DAH-3) TaxID=1198029 RepID=A0A1U7LRC3_NEOID|nr:hypothetical protein NEOLI_004496 [Neolecta irregularis DAH-3]|eukprot:OLL25207.1 hypothetical protein NEOLI_004496 [Neolecta irregularis DAH-3]
MDRGYAQRGRTPAFPPPTNANRQNFYHTPRILSPIPPSPSETAAPSSRNRSSISPRSVPSESYTLPLDVPFVLDEEITTPSYSPNISSEIPILLSPGIHHDSRGQSIASSSLSGRTGWRESEFSFQAVAPSRLSIESGNSDEDPDGDGNNLVRQASISRVIRATPQIMPQHIRVRSSLPDIGDRSDDFSSSDEGSRYSSPQETERPKHLPSPLNLHVIKEAESRGSLTSLPDLINRATRLAGYLEAGVIPSRESLSTLSSRPCQPSHRGVFLLSIIPRLIKTGTGNNFSDILVEFPAVDESRTKEISLDTSNLVLSQSDRRSNDRPPIRDRKVCGLPLPVFIYIIIFVVFTAVLLSVGIFLIKSKELATGSIGDSCYKALPCFNGGISTMSKRRCTCICTSSFTGPQCELSSDPSCSIVDTGGRNFTIGNAIPPLITSSNRTFGIYLDAWELTMKFGNISCTDQNELIRVNGYTTSEWETPMTSVAPLTFEKDNNDQTIVSNPETIGELPSFSQDKATVFSRVAILFLAENEGTDFARMAQSQLQENFNLGSQANTTVIIDNFIVSLVDGTIKKNR